MKVNARLRSIVAATAAIFYMATAPAPVLAQGATITITAPVTPDRSTVASGDLANFSVGASVNTTTSLNYNWSYSCTGGLNDGQMIVGQPGSAAFKAPTNATGQNQICTVTVSIVVPNIPSINATASGTITVSPVTPTVTFTRGVVLGQAQLAGGTSMAVSVSASYNIPGGTIGYAWSSSCGQTIGSGTFNPPDSASSTWTAPNNATGASATCTITVTATGSAGGSLTASLSVQVTSNQAPTIIFTAGPAASSTTIDQQGKVTLSATATTTATTGTVGYLWAVSCSNGTTGGFTGGNLGTSVTWQAPQNLTGTNLLCTATVTATLGTQSIKGSVLITVTPLIPVVTVTRMQAQPTTIDTSPTGNGNVVAAQVFSTYVPSTRSVTYAWSASCPGGLDSGSIDDPTANGIKWYPPTNYTSVNQVCTLKVLVSGAIGGTATGTIGITLVPVAKAVVWVTPPSANPLQVLSGGNISVTLHAALYSGDDGQIPTYAWTSSCTGGLTGDSFASTTGPATQQITLPNGQVITAAFMLGQNEPQIWTAPVNNTGSTQTCTLIVEARKLDAKAVSTTLKIPVQNATPAVMPDSGWWWNPAEAGTGYGIEASNGRIQIGAFMYRDDGSPVWYVAIGNYNNGAFQGALTEYSGTDTLLQGPPVNAAAIGSVANVSVTFSTSTSGTITFSGGDFSAPKTLSIQRYLFSGNGVTATPASTTPAPQTGWYWNSAEGGTGYFVEQQDQTIFMVCYMYGADAAMSDSRAAWYYILGGPLPKAGVTGLDVATSLIRVANGMTLAGLPTTVSAAAVGTIDLQVASATSLTLILPNGRPIVLSRYGGF